MYGSNRPLIWCGKCQAYRVPEGGVHLGSAWMCAKCFKFKMVGGRK